MALARAKVTAKGQISVPAEDHDRGKIVVRRAGRFSSEDIHRALFPNGAPKPRTVEQMKAGIERDIRERYARL